MKCRYLMTDHSSAAYNMGLDEAVMTKISEGESPPTLRLYGWTPSAVSIGYFQSLNEEVDLGKCSEFGVDVVRRITGGGAVYHDTELTYSFIAPAKLLPNDILESYKLICGGLIEGFSGIGVEASFAPLNDIIACGKKISGNAQTRRMGCVLQHGTILLNVDVEKMFSLLLVPNEKIRDKLISTVKERVTSLTHILEKETTFDDVVMEFRGGFEKSLGLELFDGEVSEEEEKLATELAESKYSQDNWNNKR